MTVNRFAVQDGPCPDDTIHIAALVKGAERYVFLYDAAGRAETLRTLGRYASNPELSFTWYDCARLAQRVRCYAEGRPVEGEEEGQ